MSSLTSLSLLPRRCQRLIDALCNLRLILNLPYFSFARRTNEPDDAQDVSAEEKLADDGTPSRGRGTDPGSLQHSSSRSKSRGPQSMGESPTARRGLRTTAIDVDPQFAELYPQSTSSSGRTSEDKERRRNRKEPSKESPNGDKWGALNPVLFAPVRAPRNPVVLCHGGCRPLCVCEQVSNLTPLFRSLWFRCKRTLGISKVQVALLGSCLGSLAGKGWRRCRSHECPRVSTRESVLLSFTEGGLSSTGTIKQRAEALDRVLTEECKGKELNLMAHSMVRQYFFLL
jgi:hypothetical protein